MAQDGFNLQSIPGQLATRESWETAYKCGTIRSEPPSQNPRCDLCLREILSHTARHRCLHCDDFDTCSTCFPSVSNGSHFIGHHFVKVDPSIYEGQSVYDGVQCDACDQVINGPHYECHQCPNYILCYACLANGNSQKHDPTHTYEEIRRPKARAQTAPALTAPENNQAPAKPGWRTIPATENWPEMIVIPKSDVPAAIKRIASCTFCKQFITGHRYKCMQCPNIDACGSCYHIHPHTFLRMSATATDIRISFASASVRAVHGVSCDGCKQDIVGIRYKCAQCADFDLCESCEKSGVHHPPHHAFIQIKTPAQTPTVSPRNVQQVGDSAKKEHEQKVAIADNLEIANNLMSIGMTLFGN